MSFFGELFSNRCLVSAFFAWAVAQILKTIIYYLIHHKWDWRRCIGGMGGMPSSHSAFVTSLMIKIGMTAGVGTPVFALSVAFMAVVLFDAMGVRRETGKQGEVLNKMLREILIEGKPITEENLKELVGHTPLEVLGGVIVGTIVALIY